MIDIKDKKDCNGCHACENICPNDCIDMKSDQEGFWYPKIDVKKCIKCNLCEMVCPEFNKYTNQRSQQPQALAGWNIDEEIRKKSSSGGIFTAVAESFIDQDGVVFGAGFNRNSQVIHKVVTNKESLEELRGSKYTQSKIGNTYKEAREYLLKGKKVLFTGTPCQIAGLYSFLQKEYTNLYTCDLVCHGVPSPKVFEKYKNYHEVNKNCKVKKVSFRDKTFGWKVFSMVFDFEDGSKYIRTINEDPFMIGFLKDKYLRPSCHECTFSTLPRIADISLADYWGVASKYPELDDDKGTSLLLVNTNNGQDLINGCRKKLFIKDCDFSHALQNNPCIAGSVNPNAEREQFFSDFDTMSFEDLIKKYMSPPGRTKLIVNRVRGLFENIKRKISS